MAGPEQIYPEFCVDRAGAEDLAQFFNRIKTLLVMHIVRLIVYEDPYCLQQFTPLCSVLDEP